MCKEKKTCQWCAHCDDSRDATNAIIYRCALTGKRVNIFTECKTNQWEEAK